MGLTVTGTYGTLTLNASTGAYSYALNNSASAVQALGASDVKRKVFCSGHGWDEHACGTDTVLHDPRGQ